MRNYSSIFVQDNYFWVSSSLVLKILYLGNLHAVLTVVRTRFEVVQYYFKEHILILYTFMFPLLFSFAIFSLHWPRMHFKGSLQHHGPDCITALMVFIFLHFLEPSSNNKHVYQSIQTNSHTQLNVQLQILL